jgi:hypothetical protein
MAAIRHFLHCVQFTVNGLHTIMFCFLAGNSFTVSKKYQQPIAFCVADKKFVFCSPEKESHFSCVTSKHFLQAENIPILQGKQ